jgi:hypothetical protein
MRSIWKTTQYHDSIGHGGMYTADYWILDIILLTVHFKPLGSISFSSFYIMTSMEYIFSI